MARPVIPREQQRSHQVRFRLTSAEWRRMTELATEAGLSVPLFMRQAALDGKVVIRRSVGCDAQTFLELRRIGVNLNQLTRAYHITGEIPSQLWSLCQQIESILLANMER